MRTTLKLSVICFSLNLLLPSSDITAGERDISALKDDELKICSTKICKNSVIDTELITTLLSETLRTSAGKALKTCQYSTEKDECSRSFISFVSKGINIFEGRAGFTGFKFTDDISADERSIKVDIDNYPWVFGSDLNEDNVKSATHQRCDSSNLRIETKERSIHLTLRDYACQGRVYSFQKNFLLTLRRIDLDTGQFLFSYYIDIRGGATGSGTGFTTLEFGPTVSAAMTTARLRNSLFAVEKAPVISETKEKTINKDRTSIQSEQTLELKNPEIVQIQQDKPPVPIQSKVPSSLPKKEERKIVVPSKPIESAVSSQPKTSPPKETPSETAASNLKQDKTPQKGDGIFSDKALDSLQKKDVREPIRVRNPLEL
jgi:hypothetical protein